MHRARRGFTLVELVAILVVFSVILAIAIPILSPILQKQKGARMQALANSNPDQVFELACEARRPDGVAEARFNGVKTGPCAIARSRPSTPLIRPFSCGA